MLNQSLILIRGIPGSGKSTLAKQIQQTEKKFLIVEADQYFIDSNENYVYNKSKIKEAHKWCQQLAIEWMQLGYSVIVANTFIRKWEMQPYTKIANELKIPITIIITQGEFQNIHNVPQSTIERMKAQFEF